MSKNQAASPFQIEVHKEHEGSVNCMAVSENGAVLATGSDDASVRIFTANTQICKCLLVMKGHSKYITCVTLEENYVISGSADKTVRKWDMSTGACLAVYDGHTGVVNRLLVAGELILSSSYDSTARAWLLNTPPSNTTASCVRLFRGHKKAVYPLAFIPGDQDQEDDDLVVKYDALITGSTDGTARRWNVENGSCVTVYRQHGGPVQALEVNHDGTVLFTGSTDSTIISWDIPRGDVLKVFQGHTQPITALLAVGKLLFSASADRTARSWVIEFGDSARIYKGHKHSVTCLAYEDGFLYTGCGDGVVRGFETKSGVLKRVFKGHAFTVNCLKVIDWKLYSGSFDGTMRLWSLETIAEGEDPNKFAKRPKTAPKE